MKPCPFCGFNEAWTRNSPWDLIEGRDPNDIHYVIQCNVCGTVGPESKTPEIAEDKWNGSLKNINPNHEETFKYALNESLKQFIGNTFISPDEGIEVYFNDDYIEFINSENGTIIYQFGIPEDGETIDEEGNVIDDEESNEGGPYLYYSGDYLEVFSDGIVEFTIYLDELQINEDVSAPMATLSNVPGTGNAQPASMAAMTGSQQGSTDAIGSGDNWGNYLGPYIQKNEPEKNKKKKKVYKKKKKKMSNGLTNEQSINPYDEIGKMMAKQMKVPLYFEKGKNQSVKHVKQKNVEKTKSTSGKYTYKVASLKDFANLVKENKEIWSLE